MREHATGMLEETTRDCRLVNGYTKTLFLNPLHPPRRVLQGEDLAGDSPATETSYPQAPPQDRAGGTHTQDKLLCCGAEWWTPWLHACTIRSCTRVLLQWMGIFQEDEEAAISEEDLGSYCRDFDHPLAVPQMAALAALSSWSLS